MREIPESGRHPPSNAGVGTDRLVKELCGVRRACQMPPSPPPLLAYRAHLDSPEPACNLPVLAAWTTATSAPTRRCFLSLRTLTLSPDQLPERPGCHDPGGSP